MKNGKVESLRDCVEDTLRRAGSPLAVPEREGPQVDALRQKLQNTRQARFEQAYKDCALIEAQASVQFSQSKKNDANADALRLVGKLARVLRGLMEIA